MDIGNWVGVIKSIKTPVSLLVLVTLIAGSILSQTKSPLVQAGTLALLFLITISIIVYAIKNNSFFSIGVRGVWNENDLPLTQGECEAWLGKWNCQWTYQTNDEKFKPYVDDIIEINEINQQTGEIAGLGYSSYIEGQKYSLRGRASNKGVVHIFYSSPKSNTGLSGIVILNRPPVGEISGWWIGAGRDRKDTGGGVTLERHDNNPSFTIKNYDTD